MQQQLSEEESDLLQSAGKLRDEQMMLPKTFSHALEFPQLTARADDPPSPQSPPPQAAPWGRRLLGTVT
jgi:hypothetical protein